DAVRPRQEAYDLHRLERRGPRIDRISADVADHIGAQGHDMALVVQSELRIDDLVKALAIAGQILHAVAGPFDRRGEPSRRRAYKNFLRVQRAFAAEAAANIRRHNADLVARHVERAG